VKPRSIVALALVGLLGAVAPTLAADAVTKCGAKKLKAYNLIFKTLYAEAGAACAAGSAGNPQPVNAVKITAAVDAVNASFAAADAEFGADNCVQFDVTAPTVVAWTEILANKLCLVP